MKVDKQTMITVGASTAIGFLGDVLTFSLGENKGKLTPIRVPKGKALVNLILLGIIGGLVIDFTIKKIQRASMSEQEKKLADLTESETVKLREGVYKNQIPVAVSWSASASVA